MTLAELVAALVARGLPFPDDSVAAGTEDSLRALLGVAPVPEREPGAPPAAASPGAPAVPAALDIAARALGKLLRARVIGGKHTRIENVYGHHFSDAEKEPARAVTEQLLRLGILLEKTNLGARHVSINPRRLEDARRLAEGRSVDREITAALIEA